MRCRYTTNKRYILSKSNCYIYIYGQGGFSSSIYLYIRPSELRFLQLGKYLNCSTERAEVALTVLSTAAAISLEDLRGSLYIKNFFCLIRKSKVVWPLLLYTYAYVYSK